MSLLPGEQPDGGWILDGDPPPYGPEWKRAALVRPWEAFNPNHAPGGSPEGGQFTSGPEGSGTGDENHDTNTALSDEHFARTGTVDASDQAARLERADLDFHRNMFKPLPERERPLIQQAETLTREGVKTFEESDIFSGEESPTYGLAALQTYKHGSQEFMSSDELSRVQEIAGKAKLPVGMTLFRGDTVKTTLGEEGRPDPATLVGKVFNPGVVSWTHDGAVGHRFAAVRREQDKQTPLLMVFDAPEGTHAVNLDAPSINWAGYDEHEWVLGDSDFKVTKAYRVDLDLAGDKPWKANPDGSIYVVHVKPEWV